MCPTEIGCGNEDKGKEDIEEDRAPDANMDDDEDTKVELKDPLFSLPERNQDEKSRDNVDLQTEINSSTGVGLQIDNHGSVVNQPDDDNNVDGIHGNNKDLKMDFVANEDKDSESVAANNAPVNAIAKEQASSKTDGSLGRPLSQVECIAAEERLSKREVENGEKGENLDDVSIVDASADGLSGSNNDGSPMDPLKRECAAANVRLSEIKDENYEMGEKLYDSLAVGASAEKVLISKNDGNLVDPLTQTECATADERPTEMKTVTDYKMDASVDVIATELHVSENDGIGSHAHMLNMAECAEADMSSSELKGRNNEKEEKLDLDVNGNKLPSSNNDGSHVHPSDNLDNTAANERLTGTIDEHGERGEKLNDGVTNMELTMESEVKELKPEVDAVCEVVKERTNLSFLFEPPVTEGNESGTEDEQAAFAKEVENFYKERNLEYKHPKFYKEDLNLLKLWRAVIQLGGYDEVTSCKLWRQVGESFNPPKTCTTVSWTFRIFYEKALLDYEKHRMSNGELPLGSGSLIEPSQTESQAAGSQSVGSGRARRDAAARAMQGWHSKRLLGSGEVCQPIIKEKTSSCTPKSDKQIKNIGVLKRKKPSSIERTIQVANMKATNSQSDTVVIDIGPPADWVKINVQRTVDCFEVYALVPGLLREEVHVQSDPAGRLVISGQPEQLDNPWGVTPFKKVVSLPSRIDPHQTSAVVTLHGQLFVRVPFEQSDM